MMYKRIQLAVACLLLVTACASDHRDKVRQGVVGFHEGIYVPAMTELGRRYDAGDQRVIANEPKIQKISEQYVTLKTEIDIAIRIWDAATSPGVVAEKMQKLLLLLTELQEIQHGGGQ